MQDKGAAGLTWTFDNLNQFLTSPKDFVPGTKMTFAGLKNEQDRANVIAYLNSNSASPLPLPGGAGARALDRNAAAGAAIGRGAAACQAAVKIAGQFPRRRCRFRPTALNMSSRRLRGRAGKRLRARGRRERPMKTLLTTALALAGGRRERPRRGQPRPRPGRGMGDGRQPGRSAALPAGLRPLQLRQPGRAERRHRAPLRLQPDLRHAQPDPAERRAGGRARPRLREPDDAGLRRVRHLRRIPADRRRAQVPGRLLLGHLPHQPERQVARRHADHGGRRQVVVRQAGRAQSQPALLLPARQRARR